MKLVLVHGFNVKDKGAHTTDRISPYAREFFEVDQDEGDYGYFNLFMIRLFNKRKRQRILYRLSEAFTDADVIITHSNGAYFTTEALEQMPVKHNNTKIVIHISPALNSGTLVPNAVKAQLVLYTPHDGWVKLASYLPLHPWGRMGARGYTGNSNKVANHEDKSILGHSDWFNDKHLKDTWSHCHEFIKNNIA